MEAPNNIIAQILENRVLTHVLFWLSSLIVFPIYGMSFNIPFEAGVIIKFFFLPAQILATYFLIYYQIPKFFYQKKYVKLVFSFCVSLLVFSTLGHCLNDFFITPQLRNYSHTPHTLWQILRNPFPSIWYNAEDIYLTVFIFAGLKFIKDRIAEKTEMEVLEQEKANAEINLLKAQINPRILSKTLHQLHILAKEKSDAAPEVVIKLSEMLDYMLYQCNSPKVLISNEIELIQHYLDLEKLRFGEDLTITFFHHLTNPSAEVAPLLLVSLAESAFLKKGEVLPPNAKVEIILQEKDDQLDFKILSNLIIPSSIENTDFKKQLNLLYPSQHQLAIHSKKNTNVIELILDLYS